MPARGNFGRCVGLSSTDTGAVLNVTIVNPSAGSFLTVWPADKDRPLASSLNWVAGQGATPNQVTTALDPSGQFSIFNNGGTVDVIVDVVGLYEPASAGGGGGTPGAQGPIGPVGPVGPAGPQGPAGLMTAASPAPSHSGQYTSMALDSAGNPVISHYDGVGALLLTHCNDPACAPGGDVTNTVDNSADVGLYSSLALDASGNPVIAYYDSTNGNLKLAHCNDANCAGGNEAINTVDSSASDVGSYSSLVLDGGIPVISYYDATAGHLQLVRCNDANCQGGDEIPQTVDSSANDVGLSTSLVLGADHRPVISYLDTTAHTIRLVHCNDVSCGGNDETSNLVAPTIGTSGQDADLALDAGGFPVISVLNSSGKMAVAHCTDVDCVAAANIQTLDTVSTSAPTYSSIVLDSNGFPVVSYVNAGVGPLKVARCTDANCLTPVVSIADNVAGDRSGPYSSLVLDGSGNPIISSYDTVSDKLVVIHCVESYCNPDLIRTITAP